MSKMLQIVDVLNTRYPVSQEEAQVIYPYLVQAIESRTQLTLSFKGIENCASIFINSLLGKLYRNYSTQVDEFITIIDVIADENAIEARIKRARKKALDALDYSTIFE